MMMSKLYESLQSAGFSYDSKAGCQWNHKSGAVVKTRYVGLGYWEAMFQKRPDARIHTFHATSSPQIRHFDDKLYKLIKKAGKRKWSAPVALTCAAFTAADMNTTIMDKT